MNVHVHENVLAEQILKDPDAKFLGSIDQGTSSTRFLVFSRSGRVVASAQMEHEQIYPKPGWHEHNPLELYENTTACILAVAKALQGKGLNLQSRPLTAIGITNQRETCIAWNRDTGIPYHNAIVWDDTRTQDLAEDIAAGNLDRLRAKTGLPLASYFSGTKVKWLLDNVPQLQQDIQDPVKRSQVCFGTVDSWIIFQLTGTQAIHNSKDKAANVRGQHLTDVSNASRWLFLDIAKVQWDTELVDTVCEPHRLPVSCLPTIRPSSHIFGICNKTNGIAVLDNVPIASVLGDQQSALFGQTAFHPGLAKNTYGTGLFLMMNTGQRMIPSTHGLLTTIGYQLEESGPVTYALEGSVSHSGSTIQWLRDQLQIISSASETESVATPHNDGMYMVPAFAGLFAPHWRSDARACIVGLTTAHHKGHVVRSALEATTYQTREVIEAMQADSGVMLASLSVDGGATANRLLLQFQADILNVPVVKPVVQETTALGVAFCAGLAVRMYSSLDEIQALWAVQETFTPEMNETDRALNWKGWQKAVEKSLGWVERKGKVDDAEDDAFEDAKMEENLSEHTSSSTSSYTLLLLCTIAAGTLGFALGQRKFR